MEIEKLSVAFKDDIINTTLNAHRRYKLTDLGENEFEFEETTEFIQKGTPFGAKEVNDTNETINALIDFGDGLARDISEILDGTKPVKKSLNAEMAEHSETAQTATSAQTAQTATSSATSDSANKLSNAIKINGVDFDGTNDITVLDNTKVERAKDFILMNKQPITFTDNVCRINDSRITENSLADIYFSKDLNADMFIETYNGYVEITTDKVPSVDFVVSIHVRVA